MVKKKIISAVEIFVIRQFGALYRSAEMDFQAAPVNSALLNRNCQ